MIGKTITPQEFIDEGYTDKMFNGEVDDVTFRCGYQEVSILVVEKDVVFADGKQYYRLLDPVGEYTFVVRNDNAQLVVHFRE